jgi:hypothetical protein
MGLTPCHECGKEIAAKAARCPHCGEPRRRQRASFKAVWILCVAVFVAGIVVVIVPSAFLPPSTSWREKEEAWANETLEKNDALRAEAEEAAKRCPELSEEERKRDHWCLFLACPGQFKKFYKAAAEGDVVVGMSGCLVKQMIGEPHQVNTTVTARGAAEQWVYSDSTRIYVQDGLVTSFQITD